MNMGREIETKRLKLLPGSNKRDSKPFLKMLREDGNFREFCGVEFSEKNLSEFANYFECTGHEECIYSVFQKDSIEEFIGYVGFHCEADSDYEIEFYIAKNHRRKGYCEEACKAVIKQIFGEGLSVDNNQITVDRLYATTLADNTPVIELLKKIGFQKDIPKDGPVLIMQGFRDEEDEIHIIHVTKMIYEKNPCVHSMNRTGRLISRSKVMEK